MKGYFANRKMRGTLFLAACFFIAWNWAGCSAETLIVEGPPKFLNYVDMPNRSLAFGFIDTAGLQVSVEWVTFELFDTPAGSLSLKAHVKRGLFSWKILFLAVTGLPLSEGISVENTANGR